MKIKLQEFVQSKLFTKIMWGLGALLALSAVFYAGIFVGFHKARFAGNFGERYDQGFEGKEHRRLFGMPMRGLPEAHGTTGKILKIELPIVIISGDDGIEKAVRISEKTEIRHFRDRVSVAALSVGDVAVVIGEPNDNAEIKARFIRLLPAPLESAVEKNFPSTTSPAATLPS